MAVIGRVLDRPGLRYVQIPMEQARHEWWASGMSEKRRRSPDRADGGDQLQGLPRDPTTRRANHDADVLEEFTEEHILPELQTGEASAGAQTGAALRPSSTSRGQ